MRVGQFEIRSSKRRDTPIITTSLGRQRFCGDIVGVRIGAGPPIPPFVPPDLNIESWLESIHKIRALNCARLYLPHFGKIDHSIPDHQDALEERVTRWSEWFKEKLRTLNSEPSTTNSSALASEFAEYEHADIIAGSSALVTDHSSLVRLTADPSYMAVAPHPVLEQIPSDVAVISDCPQTPSLFRENAVTEAGGWTIAVW